MVFNKIIVIIHKYEISKISALISFLTNFFLLLGSIIILYISIFKILILEFNYILGIEDISISIFIIIFF